MWRVAVGRRCPQRAFMAAVGMVAMCYVIIGVMFLQQQPGANIDYSNNAGPQWQPIYADERNASTLKVNTNPRGLSSRTSTYRNNHNVDDVVNSPGHNVPASSISSELLRFSSRFDLEPLHRIPSLGDEDDFTSPCVRDCKKVQQLLSTWPYSKPKAAIYYLTHSRRLQQLKSSLEKLEANFNRKYNYPIIIFHEAEFRPVIQEVRGYSDSPVFFEEIEMNLPDFLTKPVKANIDCMSTISYRHMCRFHAQLVYDYAIIKDFDYLLRLDDDSIITAPVRYDMFQYMVTTGIEYGYVWEHFDASVCVQGLWQATDIFLNATQVRPQYFTEWLSPKLFYNNFELSKTSLWKSPIYKSYTKYLDRLGGFYHKRWGDAPIKGIAVSILLPRNKTRLFDDISYKHGAVSFPRPG